MLVAWAVGLGVIVVAGVGGRLGGDDPRAEPEASLPPAAAVATPAPSAASPVVALSEPAPPPATVTGIPLWVRGTAGAEVDEVLLVLRAGEAEVSRQSTRPSRSGRFAAVFTLQPPRPAMELTVFAIAQDADASMLGEASRVVRLAPLVRTGAAPSPRPSLGEDGILGSRGVDLSEPPTSGRLPADMDSTWSWPWSRAGGLARSVYR